MVGGCGTFRRLVAVILIGLFLAASGAPCTASPVSTLSVSSFDPCGQMHATPSECAQINCKTFAVPAATSVGAIPLTASIQFHAVADKAADRLVRPPLPPPRASMI
jgi:hypothetical protein